MAVEDFQGGRLNNLSGQPLPGISHPHSKNVFQGEHPVFQVVPVASGPVTGHY